MYTVGFKLLGYGGYLLIHVLIFVYNLHLLSGKIYIFSNDKLGKWETAKNRKIGSGMQC